MYIYLITNLINGKQYVGQTTDFTRRMTAHKYGAKQLIDQAIQKYGKDNFTYEIIDQSDDSEEINNLEIKYIKDYNSLVPNGYNIHSGGRNNSIGEENHQSILTEQEAQ